MLEFNSHTNHRNPSGRAWALQAIQNIEADYNRSADTHLIKLNIPKLTRAGIDLYLKDESTHPSGSLKHRLARSLFLYGICNGWIREGTPIVESSSGSTAISEAYFARLIGNPFVAIAPKATATGKIREIEALGGEVHLVEPYQIYKEAARLAKELGGHYVDQFTYAERATDWRGNNNIAQSLFSQMELERFPAPKWIVMSAGTGGTTATLGRYIRLHTEDYSKTQLCVVDPENSVFHEYYRNRDKSIVRNRPSLIEGIGRPRVEPSFMPDVIDRMIDIPDAASIATIRWLEGVILRKCGGSTGTNLYGALALAKEMMENDQEGSIVTLICDSGERYLDTLYNDDWVASKNLDLLPYMHKLIDFAEIDSI
ncbi:PLP-dependent cysteine synthase family protein [Pseudovibrio sp. WM33]|uniref:PLP-dependent cysteine synthase family protein n=1 Tax=Pseudovibrio sp. WM33 TaxID=1735585 RepID=UPI0007B2B0CC|nr:PLP-dependent cysteine synthase family protein [Pseudovibrio sp. WM33]KZL29247.1 putative siderophore biosynthesis protein SbnA [Pseudovibrio sp. WM33]